MSSFSERYTVKVFLGESSVGKESTAHDREHDRTVVLAQLGEDRSEAAATRFRDRAGRLRGVDHKSIVKVLDVGEIDGEGPFAIFELVKGESLAARLTRDELTVGRAVEIAIALAEGLGVAHAAGVPHGEIEPGNVQLAGTGPTEMPKLTGFPLLPPKAWTEPRGYVAPEQITAPAASRAADQYSLAAVLYAALAGRAPHVARDAEALRESIAKQKVPPLHELNRDLVPFSGPIDRAMSLDPTKRFADIQAFGRALKTSLVLAKASAARTVPAGPRSPIGELPVAPATPARAVPPAAKMPPPSARIGAMPKGVLVKATAPASAAVAALAPAQPTPAAAPPQAPTPADVPPPRAPEPSIAAAPTEAIAAAPVAAAPVAAAPVAAAPAASAQHVFERPGGAPKFAPGRRKPTLIGFVQPPTSDASTAAPAVDPASQAAAIAAALRPPAARPAAPPTAAAPAPVVPNVDPAPAAPAPHDEIAEPPSSDAHDLLISEPPGPPERPRAEPPAAEVARPVPPPAPTATAKFGGANEWGAAPAPLAPVHFDMEMEPDERPLPPPAKVPALAPVAAVRLEPTQADDLDSLLPPARPRWVAPVVGLGLVATIAVVVLVVASGRLGTSSGVDSAHVVDGAPASSIAAPPAPAPSELAPPSVSPTAPEPSTVDEPAADVPAEPVVAAPVVAEPVPVAAAPVAAAPEPAVVAVEPAVQEAIEPPARAHARGARARRRRGARPTRPPAHAAGATTAPVATTHAAPAHTPTPTPAPTGPRIATDPGF